MRVLLALLLFLGSAGLALACLSEETDTEQLCDSGSDIFCRCPGGEQGSKRCNADGQSFTECELLAGGPCPERGSDTASSTGHSSGGSTSSTNAGGATGGAGGMGGTGGSMGTKELFEACSLDAECQSGKCPMGYCTKDCAAVAECPLGQAECVGALGQQVCMVVCSTQDDCDKYGFPSECGYTSAVDGWKVTTCADWFRELAFPPDGTECVSALTCNLGHQGSQHVCTGFGLCAFGCYDPSDCPTNLTCSSTTTLGSCK